MRALKFFLAVCLLIVNLSNQNNLTKCVIIPKVCPHTHITFWLYTRNFPNNPQKLDMLHPNNISSMAFNHKSYFKILIHGYTGWKDYAPNPELRPVLLERGNFNIISVDYGPLAKESCYVEAVANSNVVANCTAQLIDYLVKKVRIPLKLFHIIGFSLGAQVAGKISEYVKSGKLERITGLDPALPLFMTGAIRGKLDPNDAKFVEVIHTNALHKGKFEACGHIDFYCNGGMEQPGCEKGKNPHSCNHHRAVLYYAESFITNSGFWGIGCKTYLAYSNNWCNKSDVQIMGAYTPAAARGLYFLNTNSKPPFAQGYAHAFNV